MKIGNEVIRRNPTNGGMRTKTIVKALNIGKNSVLCIASSGKATKMDQLALEAAEEIFCNSIVNWRVFGE